jgi:hypothetical protein
VSARSAELSRSHQLGQSIGLAGKEIYKLFTNTQRETVVAYRARGFSQSQDGPFNEVKRGSGCGEQKQPCQGVCSAVKLFSDSVTL